MLERVSITSFEHIQREVTIVVKGISGNYFQQCFHLR